jgi:hypothetical protein
MKAILLIIACTALAVGCSSGDATATTTETSTTATQTASQEKAKCAGCGKEVAKGELVSHDGQMLCKECIAAHGH